MYIRINSYFCLTENPYRSLTFKISESKISAKIANCLPNNLDVIIKETESPKTYTSSETNLSSFFHSFISFIGFISGATALTITIMIYFIHLLISHFFSKISLMIMTSILTTIFVLPVFIVLFSLHGHISDFLYAVFSTSNNNTQYRNYVVEL